MLLVSKDPSEYLQDEDALSDDVMQFNAEKEAQLLLERIEKGERQTHALVRASEVLPQTSHSSFVIENARDYQRQVGRNKIFFFFFFFFFLIHFFFFLDL